MTKALLLLFLSISAWQDVKTGAISNRLIALGAVVFVTMIFIRGPSEDLLWMAAEFAGFLFRIFLFTAVFFLLFLCRMMGAGDIKVMALIGGYLGIADGFAVLSYGLIVSAAWSLLFMIHKKILIQRISYFAEYIGRCLRIGQVMPYIRDNEDKAAVCFCFVPFLWSGFLIWLVGQGGGI